LLSELFVPAALRDAVSERGWLQALLDAERGLAAAEARAGVIPAEAAAAIAAVSRPELYDPAEIGEQGRLVVNPAEPLVRALRRRVGADHAGYVHWGATSQDIVDTAAMLVARRALALVLADLTGLADACARLAVEHRDTLVVGRTLLQHGVPTTFGLKAAGWLVAVVEARRRLAELRAGLPAQLGGAVGTLAPLGERGPEVLRLLAEEVGLAEPPLPWHTNRVRVAELGSALAVAAGAAAKIGLDVVLLAQTEVGEAAEPAGEGRGGSSTMPHKENPVGSTLALACARHAQAAAGLLLGSLVQAHERAVGAWQAEWWALNDALAFGGGAVASMREVVEGLRVDVERMRANLELTDGLVMAEAASFALAERLGRTEARELVTRAARGGSFREELAGELPPDALDPRGYLGSAGVFVDRALALYEEEADG
jgi:3-carboxy-cis,cis-muconate cycloisomerase